MILKIHTGSSNEIEQFTHYDNIRKAVDRGLAYMDEHNRLYDRNQPYDKNSDQAAWDTHGANYDLGTSLEESERTVHLLELWFTDSSVQQVIFNTYAYLLNDSGKTIGKYTA